MALSIKLASSCSIASALAKIIAGLTKSSTYKTRCFLSAFGFNCSTTLFIISDNEMNFFSISFVALILYRSKRSLTNCSKYLLPCSARATISLDFSEISPVKPSKTTSRQLCIAKRDDCKS